MAVFSSSVLTRRRWFITLTLLTAIGTVAAGATLWQAMSLTSLAGVSEQVTKAKPLAGGIRLALIGILIVVWPRLQQIRTHYGDQQDRAHKRWIALRWRVLGWLLVIELVLGQDLIERVLRVIVGSYP